MVFAARFALMRWTAGERQTPMLHRQLGPVTLTGRVIDIDLAPRGWRIVVEPDPLAGLEPGDQPQRLRLHFPQTSDELNPGTSRLSIVVAQPGHRG
jgi:competence protein ComEC